MKMIDKNGNVFLFTYSENGGYKNNGGYYIFYKQNLSEENSEIRKFAKITYKEESEYCKNPRLLEDDFSNELERNYIKSVLNIER